MFYATFKEIGESDIAVFHTEQDRDNWVNYKDDYSRAMNTTESNAIFKRKRLDASVAEKRIKSMYRIKDKYNPNQEWYIGAYV